LKRFHRGELEYFKEKKTLGEKRVVTTNKTDAGRDREGKKKEGKNGVYHVSGRGELKEMVRSSKRREG